jgi:drug/metabolite transporter (DMT)-like permease
MWLLSLCMELPAAVAFTVNNIVSLVFTALVAVLLMGEERTPAWYLTVGLGVLVVVLAAWSQLQPLLLGFVGS